jgi:hypothetical protein
MQLYVALLFISISSAAQFTINETFRGSSTVGVTLGGNAMLTSGTVDPPGDGWLRLTSATTNQLGYGIVNSTFPSTLGVLVDFEYTAWRGSGSGADGFSVFLFDAAVSPFSIGGDGGSLGYANNNSPSDPGLTGAYLGIGVDEFGNFSSTTGGKNGGPGQRPNSVAVRGPQPTYTYITGNQIIASDAGAGDNGGVDYNTLTATRPTSTQFFRRLQFEIVPSGGNYVLTVRWKTSLSGNFVTLLGPTILATPPPALLKVGFAASTGAFINNHEIRNVLITTPGNVRVLKVAPLTVPYSAGGTPFSYYMEVTNGTAGTVTGINFNDPLPFGYTATLADIVVNKFGNAATQVQDLNVTPGGIITAFIDLPANTSVAFRVDGKYTGASPNALLLNVVTVGSGNITDNDLSNNVSSTSTQIFSTLPLTLKSFNTRKADGKVLLDWVTTNEQGVAYLEVERSPDGVNFTSLARIPAQGGNTPENRYQYSDLNPLTSAAYYRLKLVDLDGRFTYSALRKLSPGAGTHNWTAYPNPASSKTVVELPADWEQGTTHWMIVDMGGKKVAAGVNNSGNLLQIPVTNIAAGRYTLVVQHPQKGLRQALPLQVAR